MPQTRRDFLKASLGASTLVSLAPTVPAFLARSVLAGTGGRDAGDTVVVVVQLSGGNDGLNTVVPYDDEQYAESRPTLRLKPDEVHKIDAQLGLHPQMDAFKRLYDDGYLSIVQGVGYPSMNRDHNVGMRNWHTAQPDQTNPQTGWIGRAADSVCDAEQASVPAAFVGHISPPFALNAERTAVPTVRSLEQATLRTLPGAEGSRARRLVEAAQLPRTEQDNPLLDFVQQSTLAARAASRKIEEAIQAPAGAEYPSSPLGQTFGIVARLIRAEVGIRIFFAELGGGGIGGFDNHANQRGNHGAVLRQLAEAAAALMYDLKRDRLLDRVLLMTFSEFGRTVKENGRRGTDHGAAAPMFLAGGGLKGGLVGSHPSLTDLDQGALKFHTDFRQVYATVLDRWLGFDGQAVLGEKYEPLDVFRV